MQESRLSHPVRMLVAAVTCAMLLGGRGSAQPALLTIRVASTPDDQITPVLYAQRTGRFRQAGLDVQIEKQSGGAAVAAGVAGGSYDIGKSSMIAIYSAHERGIPFTLVAPAGISEAKSPYGYLIVAKDSAIHSGRDLNGKTLAVAALSSVDQMCVQSWMDQHGGDSKTLKIIELSQSEDGAALTEHRIDAALTVHPQVDAALATGNVRILAEAYAAIGPRYFVSAWFAMSDWATKHADAVETFARVVRETAGYTNAHHAHTAPMLAEISGIQLPVVQQMTRGIAGTTLEASLVQPTIDAAAKYGILKRSFPARDLIFSVTSAR
jgi:NitT/TauT family transport system substrate-binding protein